jgi:hypothetical protein
MHTNMTAKKFKLIVFILGLIFIAYGIYVYRKGSNTERPIQKSELTSIQGTLENQPLAKPSKSGVRGVPIELKEYPSFIFLVGSINYGALSGNFTSDVAKGDTIYLDILTYDYEAKIRKIKDLSLSEKVTNYRFIEPFSIRVKGKTYLNLEDVNVQIEGNRSLGFLFFLIGAFIYLLYGIFYWTGSIERFAIWWDRTQASR